MATNMAPAVEERQEFHLLDYWRVVWAGRWIVFSVFVIVLTLAAIGTFTQTPIYRAEATVEITLQSRNITPVANAVELGAGNYGWAAEERYFNTQYEIIKSRDVTKRAFELLDLYHHPRFVEASDPIGAFTRLVNVEPIRDTGIVAVSLSGPDPKEAQAWVNTLVQAYVDRNLELGVQSASMAVKALLAEIAPLREQLHDTQQDSFDLASAANLYEPEDQQKITSDRIRALQTQLTDTQVERTATRDILDQVEEVRRRGSSYESIPAISNDEQIQLLSRERGNLERERERLRVTYREKHTRVVEKQSEIDKVNERIAEETDRIISNLETKYALLGQRERNLRNSIAETRSESLERDREASDLELKLGEAAETRRIYDLINTRMKEISLSANLLANNLRVLDLAPLPKVPVKPRTVFNLALGAILGLFLGVGTVFFLDYLDNTIRTPEEVEQFLNLNVLAVVPKETEASQNAVKEAYQTLRTSLLFSRREESLSTVLITSAGPQEGKSCTTVKVAKAVSVGGDKTIIVDCDLRRPTIHKQLAVSREGGVTNYILSSAGDDWNAYIKHTDVPNLHVMSSGPVPPNPADVFAHERFRTLLAELKRNYRWVFIDSPPAMSLADSTILSSLSDMVVFVIKHNENDKELIRRSVNTLRRVNSSVVGAVLNSVDLERSHYKDYYYVGYYYDEDSGERTKSRRKDKTPLTPISEIHSDKGRGRSVG